MTAGNASGVNDAAAAVVVMSADRAGARRAGPGQDPFLRGVRRGAQDDGNRPVPAIRKALERAGKTLDEVDVIELNEAFAAQSLAVLKDLDLGATGGSTPTGARSRSVIRSQPRGRSS